MNLQPPHDVRSSSKLCLRTNKNKDLEGRKGANRNFTRSDVICDLLQYIHAHGKM